MSRLLPPLATLSRVHPDVNIQELASNLRAIIATNGAYRPENLAAPAASCFRISETTATSNTEMKHGLTNSQTPTNTHSRLPASLGGPPNGVGQNFSSDPPAKPFSDWLREACDPDVPIRAFALRILTQMVQEKFPDAVQAQEKVLRVCFLFSFLFFPLSSNKAHLLVEVQ